MLPLTWYADTKADTLFFQHYVIGYRQTPPYNLPSPVYIERNGGVGVHGSSWNWGAADLWPVADPKVLIKAQNAAYERFVNKLGDSSSFGATLTAELKETLGLVTGTVLRLVGAARAVKRLDFGRAASLLGLPYKERTIRKKHRVKEGRRYKTVITRQRVFTLPTGREVQKTLANGWLMYSYGVKPLVQDLYNGMDLLQRDFPDIPIKVSTRGESQKTVYDRTPGFSPTDSTFKVKVRASLGAHVSVENPNLYLANKMGLVNPVQWANEAIPFSFVVDWFSNLSSVIGSLTDFVGMNVRNPWTSYTSQAQEDFRLYGRGAFNWSKWRNVYKRDLGLVTPKLVFAYERVSWQRALNAISLLIGLLPR